MLYAILVGTLVGFLTGRLLHGEGYGFFKNLGLGLVGGLVGKLLMGVLGFMAIGVIGDMIAGLLGAGLLVLVFGKPARLRRF